MKQCKNRENQKKLKMKFFGMNNILQINNIYSMNQIHSECKTFEFCTNSILFALFFCQKHWVCTGFALCLPYSSSNVTYCNIYIYRVYIRILVHYVTYKLRIGCICVSCIPYIIVKNFFLFVTEGKKWVFLLLSFIKSMGYKILGAVQKQCKKCKKKGIFCNCLKIQDIP